MGDRDEIINLLNARAEEAHSWADRKAAGLGLSYALELERKVDKLESERVSYLARREAMVRAMIDFDVDFDRHPEAAVGAVRSADTLLRAIDETPVPEWAGGEHG